MRLLSQPWPADRLPQPTSQLLSVASTAGLLAAADPDNLLICSTESVRNAFSQAAPPGESIKPYQAELKIAIGTRLSHVVFSSDDQFLIVCAEDGGGLQVYKTAALKQGNTQHAFQLATGGIAVRALIPNPVNGHACAVVLAGGQLAICEFSADGSSGQLKQLKEGGVSCASWSAKGKQIVAGLADGTIAQMHPDGNLVVLIPKPPQLGDAAHVGTISWLDNDNFFVVYNPNTFKSDSPVDSADFMVRRVGKNESFEFRKFDFEPSSAFGLIRIPSFHHVQRIRDYEPNLKDMLMIASTCGTEIGVVARSTAPFSPHSPGVVDVYSMLTLEETRRPVLPDNPDNMDNPSTSAIGTALDLSSTAPVKRPLPKEENLDSTGPLPAFMVLNNEGVLCAWWMVHEAAIMQNSSYNKLVINGGPQAQASSVSNNTTSSLVQAPRPPQPSFGQVGFAPPAFGQAAQPAFGQVSKPTFGQPSQPKFGQPSQPMFGQASQPSFGAPSGLGIGQNAKPLGTGIGQNTPTFGSGMSTGSQPSGFGGFSNTSQQSGFGALGKGNTGESVFASANKESGTTFGAGSGSTSIFQKQETQSPFAMLDKSKNENSFSTVTLGSTVGSNNSFIGSSLGGNSMFPTPALSNNPSDATRLNKAVNNAEDSDMNMDSISGLQIETKKPEDREETPKPQAAVKVEKEEPKQPAEPPLPPDPSTTTKPEQQGPPEGLPLPGDQPAVKKESPETKTSAVPEPAPLPPSPKLTSTKPVDSTTPVASPAKEANLGAAAQTKLPEKAPTPPVDFKPQDAGSVAESRAGSEPEDLGNDSAYIKSPTRSQLPTDEDRTQTGGISTWPRSPRGKAPIPVFGQQTPGAQPIAETTTPLFSPDASKKGSAMPTPFTTKPLFPPPQPQPSGADSPRSPSPVRDQQIAGRRVAQPRRPSGSPTRSSSRSPSRVPSATVAPVPPAQPQQQQRVTTPQLPPVNETPAPQVDQTPKPRGDELVLDDAEEEAELKQRSMLEQPLQASHELGAFEAHSDYVGHIKSSGLASRLERVYRDMESMVDTLGWNARTMHAFIKYQDENYKQTDDRSTEDLQPEKWDSWTLDEIKDLNPIVQDLGEELAEARPQDARGIQGECKGIMRAMSVLTQATIIIQRQLAEIRAAQESATPRSAGRARLSADQTAVISKLRANYAKAQSLLHKSEEAASVLHAKITALASTSDLPGAARTQVPTVEAVTNTIAKMTRMAEQKRGDMDVLESQVRRIRRERRMRESGSQASPGPDDDLGISALSLGASVSTGSPKSHSRSLRRSIGPSNHQASSSPLSARQERKLSTPRSKREGSYVVPEDSSSEGGASPIVDAERDHLLNRLRRSRESLQRKSISARQSEDDMLDERDVMSRRMQVMETLQTVVESRHRESIAQLQAQGSGN